MKKVLSSILIAFVVFANLFAPFSVGLGEKNNIKIQSNKAEAGLPFLNGDGDNSVKLIIDPYVMDTKIKIGVHVEWDNNSIISDTIIRIKITKPDGTSEEKKPTMNNPFDEIQDGEAIFDGLKPGTSYEVTVYAFNGSMTTMQTIFNTVLEIFTVGFYKMDMDTGEVSNSKPYIVTTLTEPVPGFVKQEMEDNILANDAAMLPICALNNVGGCVGIVLYRLIFQPSSFLFAISGKAVDYTFNYSIKDSSYRSQFVVQGWGVVRDFCNLFFIFVLLYIAFGTILNLHSVKTKEMIINVVIIGLLINFSLFTTQVIIDASNILARVFYNNMIVGNKVNGVVQEKTGTFGEKQISEAVVKKVNPQQIIMRASEASNIKTKGTSFSGDQAAGTIDNTTFIVVTILASIMNIVGLIAFFGISLILLTRVIGLWLAMIFVPLAFFTYIIPQAQDIDMVGWKKWWPETLKMAFLAPVFMFFMYLIVKFLETGLGIVDASNKTGTDFFIAVLIPFAFLMILLMKAKDIAKDMSGKMGQSITNGIAALGGLALGGAALGGALLGRRLIGNPMKMAVQSQETRDAAIAKGKLYNPATWGKYLSAKMANVPHNIKTGKDKTDAHGNVVTDAQGNAVKETWGDKILDSQKKKGTSEHSRQVLDDKVKALHMGDKYDNNLTFEQKDAIKKAVDLDLLSKANGFGGDFSKLTDKAKIDRVNQDYEQGFHNEHDYVEHNASQMEKDLGSKVAMGEFVGALRKGTYDMRNLSQLTTKSKGLAGISVGLVAAVAGGVRMGLKSGAGIEHGKGQGDFMKDLGDTVKEALKGVKIEAPKSSGGGGHGGGGGGHDAHGGGGGHH